jgi:hypothetical protein
MTLKRWKLAHRVGWEHATANSGAPDAPMVGPVQALELIDHTLLRGVRALERIERHLRPKAQEIGPLVANDKQETRKAIAGLVLARIRELPPEASPEQCADAIAGLVLSRLEGMVAALDFYRRAGQAELAEDAGQRARVAMRFPPR